MNRILIIEDEAIAAQHLSRLITEELGTEPDITVLQSIEESVEYFKEHEDCQPSLCFMDIHLADGLSFRIFNSVQPTCPIIFTTAYDKYALDAFRVGGIDYLLKPIDRESLRHSLKKLAQLGVSGKEYLDAVERAGRHYHSHFLVPENSSFVSIDVKQIACWYLENKLVHAVNYDGQIQMLDRPLDYIMEKIDPDYFFRANRQYIVAHDAIEKIDFCPNYKLALTLKVPTPTPILLSRNNVSKFKRWYTKYKPLALSHPRPR